MCKTSVCVLLFADIIIRSSDIDLEFVKMLQHPSATAGSSHRTILTASDGTNHVVYNLHTMSPNGNIISCDSIEGEEEATTTTTTNVTPINQPTDAHHLTVQASASAAETTTTTTLVVDDDDLSEFVICEKADDSKSPNSSSYNLVVVAASPPLNSHNVLRHTIAANEQQQQQIHQNTLVPSTSSSSSAVPVTGGSGSSIQMQSAALSFIKEDASAKFMCSKCGSKFSALRNMKRHYHHECGIEPKHGCDYCPMRFKRRNLLKYHVLRKHTAKSN